MVKKIVFLIVFMSLLFCCGTIVTAQALSVPEEQTAADFLIQGFEAFKNNDWDSALFFLRKAVSLPDASTPEVLYMLVMSEMFAEKYDGAIKDGELFLSLYPDSPYASFVEYQIGRALHYVGHYDASIKRLGLFCSMYPQHELFSSGLFWMAESLFATFYFDLAKPLYQRIVNEYPDSVKYTECVYRIDLICQREREEKLLYLLKVTGEEYLSSKEEYERQLKQYQTEESLGLRKQLTEQTEELQLLKSRLQEATKERDFYIAENDNLLKQNELLQNDIKTLQAANDKLFNQNEELLLKKDSAEQNTEDLSEEQSTNDVSTNQELEAQNITNHTSSLQDEMRLEIEKLKRKAVEIQKTLDTKKVLDNSTVIHKE